MIVTGAFLATEADAIDGKLFVRDGVHTHFYQARSGSAISTKLVILTQAEPDDQLDVTIPVSITNPAGERGEISVAVPEITRTGTSAGFLIEPISFSTPQVGRYVLTVGSIAIPIEIVPAGA